MTQEQLDFDTVSIILEEDSNPHCSHCGDELIVDINWWISYLKINKYQCKPCSSNYSKLNRKPKKKANLDPNKEWDPEYIRPCSKCKTELNAEVNFCKDSYISDGYKSWCHDCVRKGEQTPRAKFRNLCKGAKRRGYDWTLTFEDTSGLLLDDCHYCGKHSIEEVKLHGLDRVDNNRGYHMDNVVTCCGECNMAKSTQTEEEFIQQAHNIAKRHPQIKDKRLNTIYTNRYKVY
jgi:hypothetical protein